MYKLYVELTQNGAAASYTSYDNDSFSFDLKEEKGSIKGIFTAKKDMMMKSLAITTEKDFDDDDLFYANGYQAWTTSREFSKNDKFDGLMEIAKISKFTAHFVGLSGDYHFATSYGEKVNSTVIHIAISVKKAKRKSLFTAQKVNARVLQFLKLI